MGIEFTLGPAPDHPLRDLRHPGISGLVVRGRRGDPLMRRDPHLVGRVRHRPEAKLLVEIGPVPGLAPHQAVLVEHLDLGIGAPCDRPRDRADVEDQVIPRLQGRHSRNRNGRGRIAIEFLPDRGIERDVPRFREEESLRLIGLDRLADLVGNLARQVRSREFIGDLVLHVA